MMKYVIDHRSKYPMPDDIRQSISYVSGLTMFTSVSDFIKIKVIDLICLLRKEKCGKRNIEHWHHC